MALASSIIVTCGVGAKPPGSELSAEPYYDLGNYHYHVTTDSRNAQLWFDRGLAMCHAFNHEEAVRCFERALQADPGMPMALWGMAYAWGPYINNMEIAVDQMAQAELAIRLAKLCGTRVSDVEAALIEALAFRYAVPVPDDRAALNQAYADAMRGVHTRFSNDPLVTALFAESLMNLRPWQQWTPTGEPAPETPEIMAVLESGLDRWPTHPLICHLYIHASEASPSPQRALSAAQHLGDSMPGAGHLVHMPSHIYVLIGDYEKVIDTNRKAIAADAEFLRRAGANNFYTLYRIHNYHFLVYGAMFDGQSETALTAARELVEQIPEPMLRAQSDLLDAFIATPLHVLVRFGRWNDVLAEPEPPDYLPATRAFCHYARALAYAATGRIDEAHTERQAFAKAVSAVPETSMLFNNSSRSLLGVAEAMITAEIAYREGEFDKAFAQLREAVNRDDALNYDEPWGWMQPARHALGALLLEQQRPAESEAVFRADLERHPRNPWALHGLAESLARQGKPDESAAVRSQFIAATRRCDVDIDRSCYCRLTTEK
ncbi:MAG: tetratricopeptide repeat protein [Pirellulales bacterium]